MSDDAGRLTTASLLNGLREGDDGKWTRFVCAYGPIVVAWVRKAGIDAIEVEDLAQEIFIAASKGLENYRHESSVDGSLRRWLWGITRNKVASFHAVKREIPQALGGTTAMQMVKELPDVPFEEVDQTVGRVRRELAARALQVIQKDFEERTWQAFWQSAIEGHPTVEVAGRLQMSANQVRQSRSRVLRRLRQEFGVDVDLHS